jgi:4-diphosphocytidyl-2-C-methyl-D-erythritol kinase
VIGEVLSLLGRNGSQLARMSGSGATCFALYPDDEALRSAAAVVRAERPDWWQMEGHLR